ncbi:MAG: hypothetical protein ACJASC_003279 [Limimaricola cinnabarinus]|jgi:hypothetical protein|uniref:hypothetical protein n=1 Tax=Limimaricola cinnabarinus TaxID=1125964 RepID=UPI0039E4C672
MSRFSELRFGTKQERLRFESLAIVLEAHHDNVDARMRHCREAAGILRQMIGYLETLESEIYGSGSEVLRVPR